MIAAADAPAAKAKAAPAAAKEAAPAADAKAEAAPVADAKAEAAAVAVPKPKAAGEDSGANSIEPPPGTPVKTEAAKKKEKETAGAKPPANAKDVK